MSDISCHKIINKSYFDKVLALILFAVTLILALSLTDNSCYWGDDFAAYITQGIAIAEGRLDEQAYLNKLMHPSPLPQNMEEEQLFYVWGYPLLLALVYRLVGFDRIAFSSVAYYKLPSILALALLTVVLYFFLRRRFGYRLSFIVALLFGCCPEFFNFIHTLYSDVVFLFFAVLALLICEVFLEQTNGWRRCITAFVFGVVLWFMYEVRLNGISILLSCILAHLIHLIGRRRQPVISPMRYISELIPYLVFAVLVIVSQGLIAVPTSNTGDLGHGLSLPLFIGNLLAHFRLIWHWFALMWNSLLINPLYSIVCRFTPVSFESFYPLRSVLITLSCLLFAAGVLFDGGKRNLHLTVLLAVYLVTASTLPYSQGLRYIYPLLPIILMFSCYGLVRAARLFSTVRPSRRFPKLFCLAVYLSFCFFIVYPHISDIRSGDKGIVDNIQIASSSDIYMQNAYSEAAVEVYNFIQEQTAPDCTIAFFAPRALYLNTQRFSIRAGVNGHSVDEADYFLQYLLVGQYPPDLPPEDGYETVFENYEFILYQKIN